MRPYASMRYLIILLGLLVLGLVGCGGGGGGGGEPPKAKFVIVLDPSSRGQGGVAGQSVRIRLTDPVGNLVEERRIDVSGSAAIPVDFPALPVGDYRAVLDLNENATFSGEIVGELVIPVPVNADVQERVRIGAVATALVVLPANPTIPVGTTVALAAIPRTSDGAATFAPVGGITWSGGNASGRVSESGVVNALAPGSVVATSRLSNPALSGSTTVNVTPASVENTTALTVFVYLSSANDYYPLAQRVIDGLERNSTGNVRYVIQWKNTQILYPDSPFDGTRRYEALADNSTQLRSKLVEDLGPEVDMANPNVLSQFLDWGIRRYPSQRYGLLIWGRASGYSRGRDISYDDEYANSMSPAELAQGLGSRKFDFIILDGNDTGLIENLYPIRDNANQFLVNAGEMPTGGFRYGPGLDKIGSNVNNSDLILRNLLNDLVNAFPEFPMRPAIVRGDRLQAVASALSAVSDALRVDPAVGLDVYNAVLAQCVIFDGTTYGDLASFGDALAQSNGSARIKSAGTALAEATRQAVTYSASKNQEGSGLGFETSPRLLDAYRALTLSQAGNWDEWLSVVNDQ